MIGIIIVLKKETNYILKRSKNINFYITWAWAFFLETVFYKYFLLVEWFEENQHDDTYYFGIHSAFAY